MEKKRLIASMAGALVAVPCVCLGLFLRWLGASAVASSIGSGVAAVFWLAAVAYVYWRSVGIIPWSGKPWPKRSSSSPSQ